MQKMFMLLVVGLALTLGGCMNKASGFRSQEFEERSFHNLYVAHQPNDGRNINLLIKSELEKSGYKVSTGSLADLPKDTDGLVTYVDKWMWDFRMYMYEFTIFLKNPVTEYPIASGHSLHGSLTSLSPEEMVEEATNNMLRENND